MEIEPVGLFATPDDMKALQDYLALFHGSEAIVANTCAWMAWNLAAKLTNPEPFPREHEEGYDDDHDPRVNGELP